MAFSRTIENMESIAENISSLAKLRPSLVKNFPRQRGSVIRALLEQQGLFEKRKRNHVAKF